MVKDYIIGGLIIAAIVVAFTISIVKTVKKMGEDSKVSIRTIRRDALDFAKNLKKNNEISEDELKGEEDEVQKITDKFVTEIDNIIAAKEKEIMQV